MHFTKSAVTLAVTALAPIVISTPVEVSHALTERNELVSRGLAKRTILEIACGLYAAADYGDTWTNQQNLQKKPGTTKVGAHTCNRVGCYNSSGVYICNDTDQDQEIPFTEVGMQIGMILSACRSGQSQSLSGRFSNNFDNMEFNVNVGYCNDKVSVSDGPSTYTSTLNGNPSRYCGMPGQSACSFQECKEGTIKVTSQTSRECGRYLGATYIGPGAMYQYSTQRSIGESFNIGGWLGIDSGELSKYATGLGGFSASYTKTTTTGTTSGSSAQCGDDGAKGDWTCSMEITPKCFETRGTCDVRFGNTELGETPFAVTSPQQVAGDDQGVYTANICVCKEQLQGPDCPGWDQEGAPKNICDPPCATCNSL